MIKVDKEEVEIVGDVVEIMAEFVLIGNHLKNDIGEEFFNKAMKYLEEVRSGEFYEKCKKVADEV